MGLFGLVTKRQYDQLVNELTVMKNAFAPYEHWQLETSRAERFNLPDTSVYHNQADLYRRASWVLQCVDITASASALTPFAVARVVAGKEPKDIPNHPFEMLLRNPNPFDSRYEFLYATIAMFMLNGNAYWWLNRRDEYNPPEEMWYIPPHMIQPIPDANNYLRGYSYSPGTGAKLFFEPHEIVHFKRYNPFSRFVGLSAVESIAMTALGDLGMQEWQTRLFGENNARLPSVMTFEQMIEEGVWQKIKDDTREAAKKREMLMLRGVGAGGVQWIQNAMSQKDMEFLAARSFNKEEIFGTLAPGLFSMLSENATEANSRTGRAAFNELTVYPKHVLMAEKITNSILPTYQGRPLIGHFEDIRMADKAMQLQEQDEYAKTHTVAEVREKFYGDPPLGDERDNLLPAQVTAGKAQVDEAPPAMIVRELDSTLNEAPDEPQTDEAMKMTLASLDKFERYAIRKGGRDLKFVDDILPDKRITDITKELSTVTGEADIKGIFKRHRHEIIYTPTPATATAVLEGIRLALGKL